MSLSSTWQSARSIALAAVLALAFGAAVGAPASALADSPIVTDVQIGTSQGGQPLMLHRIGAGLTRVFLLGGQHGGPEEDTITLANQLLAYFTDHADQLPANIGVDVLPMGNPDGVALNIRQFLSGVDPNRNWGGPDWASDGFDSNAQFRGGLGGPAPFSEPETRALADWLLANPPAFVVNYHSAGGFIFGPTGGPSGDLASAYAAASGYARPQPGGPSPLPYRATGSMNVWLGSVGLPAILVELTTPTSVELDRNLAGVQAVIAAVAAS